jgi:negative regulator of sigma E activity
VKEHSMKATQTAGDPAPDDSDLERLSAWLDGELDPGQDGAMLERLKADPALRARFEWFNLAGDALRSHDVAACHRPQVVDRVRQALRTEPVRFAPGALAGAWLRRHLATGMTVAAAAGMLAVVALPQLRYTDAGAPGPVAAAPAPVRAAPAGGAGPMAVLAGSVQPAGAKVVATRSPQLEAYFRAHRELAASGVMPSAAAYIRMSAEQDR